MGDIEWDFWSSSSRPNIVEQLRREFDELDELVADPAHWTAPTACTGWDVRDMVGHLVDATQSYLDGFEAARNGVEIGSPVGIDGMAKASDEAARAFRTLPRELLLGRLHKQMADLLGEFDGLTDDQWSCLLVPDRYLGMLPASIIAVGLLGGMVVHGWDVRHGLGVQHPLHGDAADLLVPFTFLLLQATVNVASVKDSLSVGISTSGRNGGDVAVAIGRDGLTYGPGDVTMCDVKLSYDPGSLVLAAYGRADGGTLVGDHRVAAEFRSLFTAI
jgi:uncharacterized protein (TIGR03083 family)